MVTAELSTNITYMQVTEINRAEHTEHYGFVHADITG